VAVLEVEPVPPSVETIAEVVLFLVPLVTPVTLIEMTQLPGEAAMDALLKDRDISPEAGENIGEDDALHPDIDMDGVAATCNPAGRESVKFIPDNTDVFGLVKVKVRVLFCPTEMMFGENAFVIPGGENKFIVADAVRPVPPFVDEIVPVVFR
jgi:hypothetical protein